MGTSRKLWRNGTGRGDQRGYILLTLMLFVALLAIAATTIAPVITFQIRRDREEEMVHRGVQYSRAVRRYFKKFGRFPTRLEELENTNNLRFLRKRYKDPITGKDFKVLHLGDVKLSFGAGIAGANPAGVPTLGGALQNQALQNQALQNQALQNQALQNQALVAAAAGVMANAQTNTNLNPGQAPGSNPPDASSGPEGSAGIPAGTPGSPGTPSLGGFSNGPTFGGGPIVGVASVSEKQSIREFNKKNHYNQWQFIYDPGTDRGGLLNAPAQPPLQNAVQVQQPGVPGSPGGAQGIPGQQPLPGPPPAQGQPAPQ